MSELTDRGKVFRAAIVGFIEARREAKLKGKDDNADTASKYGYAIWLTDAAGRVGQIQAVTHVLKATHPDARGSSLHVAPTSLPHRAEIGSHLLGKDYAEDVVGNAAAAHFYTFLNLEVDGKRLLDWMQAGDADLQTALSDHAEQAKDWMQAFASLVREEAQPASHSLAKQLYWLTGEDPQDDAQYHLLQPMFASSLAHVVHADIHDARFGEDNKAARLAFRGREPHHAPYRSYPELVERHLGAPPKPTNKSKHLNISHLNAERLGRNYLLASLPPPVWKPRDGVNLLTLNSIFDETRGAFLWFDIVRDLVSELATLLTNKKLSDAEIRTQRKPIEKKVGAQLAEFGTAVRGRYEAGWTRDEACRLPEYERLWLDPGRTEDDTDFKNAYDFSDWADKVATHFGLWLNGQLRKRSDKLTALGEAEMRHFARRAILDVAWPIPLQRRATGGVA